MDSVLDKKSRLELLKKAPIEVQEMYGNEDLGDTLLSLANVLNMNADSAYDNLALTVGDVILRLYKKSLLPQVLKDRLGLNENQITIVVDALSPFLERIPELPSTPEPVPAIPPTSTTAPNIEDAANKMVPPNALNLAPLAAVKPMRTYSDDVNMSRAHSYGAFRPQAEDDTDEPTHSSSQDDLMRK
jgi:hypothetical protein